MLIWKRVARKDSGKADENLQAAKTAFENGDMEKALSLAAAAREGYEAIKDTVKLGAAHGLIAPITAALGQMEAAAENYAVAARYLPEALDVGDALLHLADIQLAQGDTDTALATLLEARETCRKTPCESLLTVLCRIAYIHFEREEWIMAERWYREALALAGELDAVEVQDSIYLELGNAVAQQGRMTEASVLFEQGAAQARATGDKDALSAALHGLAVTAVAAGDIERARGLFQATLDLKRALGDTRGAAHTMYEMGVMLALDGACDDAQVLLGWSLEMYEQACAPEVEVARAACDSYALAC